MLDHLNLFAIDFYNKQQQSTTNHLHDNLRQSSGIKSNDESVDYLVTRSPLSPTHTDQPLLIVLDNDDDDYDCDNNNNNRSPTFDLEKVKDSPSEPSKDEINMASLFEEVSQTVKQVLNENKSIPTPVNELKKRRPRKSRLTQSLNDRPIPNNKSVRIINSNSNLTLQRHKLAARRKNHMNTSNGHLSTIANMSNGNGTLDDSPSSTVSLLSTISFDDTNGILTVSRTGSIFYCIEDLYAQVFSSLCTADEFLNLLMKPDSVTIKQVRLTEKMAIEQQSPTLPKFNDTPYRLISIGSSDYLLKLKQLLSSMTPNENLDENGKQIREQRLNQLVEELRSYKRTPTPIFSKDKTQSLLPVLPMMTTKIVSSDDDDDEPRKRLKIVPKKLRTNEKTLSPPPQSQALPPPPAPLPPPPPPPQFGIYIQCNGPVSYNIFSSNETAASSTGNDTTITTVAKTNPPHSTPTKLNEHDNQQLLLLDKLQQKLHIPRCYLQEQSANKYPIPATTPNSSVERPLEKTRSVDVKSPLSQQQINPPTSVPTCLSSSLVNIPFKRRILNSYNSDASDSSSTTAVTVDTSTTRMTARLLRRSKSFSMTNQRQSSTISVLNRSHSLPSIVFDSRENIDRCRMTMKTKKSTANIGTKVGMISKTEPIDLTDEVYSMPMIVNVEENVEIANQRQKLKNAEKSASTQAQRPVVSHIEQPQQQQQQQHSPSIIPRSIPSDTTPATLSRPAPVHSHPPVPSSFYSNTMRTPYVVYNQDTYDYRDSTQSVPPQQLQSNCSHLHYPHPSTNTNGALYRYPYHPSQPQQQQQQQQQQAIRKSKELSTNYCSTRPGSVVAMHPSTATRLESNIPAAVVMPIVRKPNFHHTLTAEQQASIKMQSSPPSTVPPPCRLACCCPPMMQTSTGSEKMVPMHQASSVACPNERIIYRQYATSRPSSSSLPSFKRDPSQSLDTSDHSLSPSRKHRRLESAQPSSVAQYPVYSSHGPSSEAYFASPNVPSHWPSPYTHANMKAPVRYSYPQVTPAVSSTNGVRKMMTYPPPPPSQQQQQQQPRRPIPVQSRGMTTPVVAQSSSTMMSPPNTPHELTLPTVRSRSIDLQRAIVERGYVDVDKLPKLVVRHTKTYATKTIDNMGQLFPTWFNEPDYRCVHCFRCDQVFTPQQFMTHIDDEQMQNEQPISMTSIQLLTSEKMSEYKVGLWNQFCTNLTIYAREGRIGGFSTNRNV